MLLYKVFDLFMSFSFLRLVSLIGTIAFFWLMSPYEIGPRPLLSGSSFVFIVWLTGVVHFVLGIVYALAAIDVGRFSRSTIGPLAVVLGGGAGLFFAGLSPNIMQAYHHAASEAYTDRSTGVRNHPPQLQRLQLATFWMHLILFFFLARGAFQWADLVDSYLSYWFLDVRFLGVGLAIAYIFYFYALFESRSYLSKRELFEFSMGEIILLVAIGYSLVRTFSTLELAVYHRFFWTLYPAAVLLRRSMRKFTIYWILTVSFTWGLYAISDLEFIKRYFVQIYIITGVSHIILSIPFSHANPGVIKRFMDRNKYLNEKPA